MAQLHVMSGADARVAHPVIRNIAVSDLIDALARGWADFSAMPSHALFLCLIYPLVAVFVGGLTMGYNILPLAWPVVAGFALLGPLVAIGLYEMSRRREAGLEADPTHAFDIIYSPSLPAIGALGLILLAIFLTWVYVAQQIYIALFGYLPPASLPQFVANVLTTPEGWQLIMIGNLVGFVFALLAFALSVISFPLLLDRDVGLAAAITTSFRAIAKNPVTMLVWGMMVAGLLLLGALPFFVGLAVVVPLLGHATWHLYRKLLDVSDLPPHELQRRQPKGRRYAADFPAALFPAYHKDQPPNA
jgi:uncharacterized membrane protein